jgi:hypothetical protein
MTVLTVNLQLALILSLITLRASAQSETQRTVPKLAGYGERSSTGQRAPREARQGEYQDDLRVRQFFRELTERMMENSNKEYTDSRAEHAS